MRHHDRRRIPLTLAIAAPFLMITACADDGGSATGGALEIVMNTSGANPDPDGYEIAIGGGTPQPIGTNATLTVGALDAGPYTVAVSGVAVNCEVAGTNPRTVNVVAGDTVSIAFSLTCVAFAIGEMAFTSDRAGGNGLIFLMDGEGGGVEQVTTGGSSPQQDFANLSPDRSKILFTDFRPVVADPSHDIYVVNVDGSGLIRLTDDPARDWDAAWSPDGTQVAFQSERDGDWAIYTMNADGSGQTRVTDGRGPDWSPDGSTIVFFDDQDGDQEIYLIGVDGSGRTQLTQNSSRDLLPAWSPDGEKIAFESDSDGDFNIYFMDADGSNVVRLTDDPGNDSTATWSPDGLRIAFTSDRDGDLEIYAQHVDRTGLVKLTDNAASDTTPHWR